MIQAKDAIQHILAAHPDLNENGWQHRGVTQSEHDQWRAEMTSDQALEQFARATEFLGQCQRRESVWTGSSSYGWKHQAENYFKGHPGGSYVSNGIFIAAALALKFIIKRIPDSPNCWLNISKRSIRRTRVAFIHNR